tara:strand:+ start:304 stop:606 length:303 start_codon:yes stop_codon:yes gene_type:complete
MKKILFIMIALVTLSTTIYASFPVTENGTVVEKSMNQPEAPASDIDWGLAAVCWLVGSLGIHRFMIGDTTNGILMLLTLGGCGIWTLIDLISILSGKMSR